MPLLCLGGPRKGVPGGEEPQKDTSLGPTRPSPEAFPDRTEVFGGLDGKDDAGDEEEGAPRQAEPEGILEQVHAVSSPGRGAVPPFLAPSAQGRSSRGQSQGKQLLLPSHLPLPGT